MADTNQKHTHRIIRQLTVILALSVAVNLHAQKYGVFAGAGGATFNMADLKYYQEQLLADYPVEGKIISNFPSYLIGSVNVFRNFNDYLRIGIEYTFLSTGAKANYTDYSGSFDTYQLIKSHQFSATANYRLLGSDHLELLTFGSLSASYSNLELSQYILANSTYFGTYYDSYQVKYKSLSPVIAVGLEGILHLSIFSIGMDGGYYHDLTGELIYTEDSYYKLKDPNDPDRILRSDWSGFRARLKIFIFINNPKSK